jgi:hypothetical protein
MTHWFDRQAGQQIVTSIEQPDPHLDEAVLLIMDGHAQPDWVRVPSELGGGQRRVIEVHQSAPCAQCKANSKLWVIAGPEKYHVSECLDGVCGFVWFQFPEKKE